MKWNLLELGPEQLKQFSERFGTSSLVAQVFLRRGIEDAEELRWYLDTNIRSTHNPFLFNDMENVVERISQAGAESEKVMVFGDRDVDGISASVLLIRRLKKAGLEPLWSLPLENSPYGLTLDGVRAASEAGVTLIITVDCGITNLDEIDAAVDAGIDVIVIDHHNPQDELPAAVATINPKTEVDGYPFSGLSAAALVGKVAWALDFAQTPLYGEEQCLINIRPGKDSLVFEAVRLRNMIEQARLTETIVDGNSGILESRVIPFLQGVPLFIYEKKSQMPLLKKLFGQTTEIFVTDIADETWKTFPDLKDRSLLRMIPGSRLARFSREAPGEIDVLKHLTLAVFQARIKEVWSTYDEYQSLVTLSLLADMMPMKNENRILVRRGLESLQNVKQGGLHSLLRELGLVQPPLSLKDVSWKVSPVINSSGRMGRPDVALRLLLSDDPSQCLKLVKELVEMNEERKKQGDLSTKRVSEAARLSFEEHKGRFIIVRDDQIPRGITGILAGRLAREFNAPSAVLAQIDGSLIGSMRTARGFNVTSFLSHFSDIFVDWGGHDAAGGFNLPAERFSDFSARLSSVLDGFSLQVVDEPTHLVDLLVAPEDMNENLWKIEETFLPAGQESLPILYQSNALSIKALSLMGKEQKHVRMTLDSGPRQWPAVFWDAVERVNRDFALNDRVDVLFRLERNNWGANTSLQLNIVDIRRVQG